MFSPIFRSQEKSSMLFGRGTVKSVMNITKKFDTAASKKELWHSRGSPDETPIHPHLTLALLHTGTHRVPFPLAAWQGASPASAQSFW